MSEVKKMQILYSKHVRFIKFPAVLCLQTDAGFLYPAGYSIPGHASATPAHVMAHKIPMPQKNVAQ